MTELESLLKSAEETQKFANETIKKYTSDTKSAIEKGEIGRAAQLFEEACAYCDKNEIPKEAVLPLGYAILLLQACDNAVKNNQNPQ